MNKNHVGADALVRPVERGSTGSWVRTKCGARLRRADGGVRPCVVCGQGGTFADNIRSLSLWQHGACFKNQN
jgi:hypothetical protein